MLAASSCSLRRMDPSPLPPPSVMTSRKTSCRCRAYLMRVPPQPSSMSSGCAPIARMRMEYPSHAESQSRSPGLELQSIHNTADAVLHHRRTKVDEKAQSAIEQPQIRQTLFGVHAGDFLHRLQ